MHLTVSIVYFIRVEGSAFPCPDAELQLMSQSIE